MPSTPTAEPHPLIGDVITFDLFPCGRQVVRRELASVAGAQEPARRGARAVGGCRHQAVARGRDERQVKHHHDRRTGGSLLAAAVFTPKGDGLLSALRELSAAQVRQLVAALTEAHAAARVR